MVIVVAVVVVVVVVVVMAFRSKFLKYDNRPKSQIFEAKSGIFEAKSEIFEAKRTKPNPRTQKNKKIRPKPNPRTQKSTQNPLEIQSKTHIIIYFWPHIILASP